MRLDEILTETPFTDKQEQRFLQALRADLKSKDKEWPSPVRMSRQVRKVSPPAERIGRGMYSQAFGRRNSNVAVKTTTSGEGEATLEFLKYAKRRSRNPHLPKIYSIEEFPGKDYRDFEETHVYARMERLADLNLGKFNWKPEHVPFLFWMRQNEYADVNPSSIVGVRKWKKLVGQADKKRIRTSRLVKTLQDIEQWWGDRLDIFLDKSGAHNIMVRPKTGEIVILDPVA